MRRATLTFEKFIVFYLNEKYSSHLHANTAIRVSFPAEVDAEFVMKSPSAGEWIYFQEYYNSPPQIGAATCHRSRVINWSTYLCLNVIFSLRNSISISRKLNVLDDVIILSWTQRIEIKRIEIKRPIRRGNVLQRTTMCPSKFIAFTGKIWCSLYSVEHQRRQSRPQLSSKWYSIIHGKEA